MDEDEWDDDPLFELAVIFVIDSQKASISGVQRKFRIGYNRAVRLVEKMEEIGVVSEQGKDGNRTVLLCDAGELASHRIAKLEEQPVDMSNVIMWPGSKK
ncbi:TPA: DNA translocase FtsK [Serratia fonticola]